MTIEDGEKLVIGKIEFSSHSHLSDMIYEEDSIEKMKIKDKRKKFIKSFTDEELVLELTMRGYTIT